MSIGIYIDPDFKSYLKDTGMKLGLLAVIVSGGFLTSSFTRQAAPEYEPTNFDRMLMQQGYSPDEIIRAFDHQIEKSDKNPIKSNEWQESKVAYLRQQSKEPSEFHILP